MTTTNRLTGAEAFYLIGIPAYEASDPDSPARRAAAGARAGRDVQKDRNAIERDTVRRLLQRLQSLRADLASALVSAVSTDFRRFTAQALIERVDILIAQANVEIANLARSGYVSAQNLGRASVEEPITAARLSITSSPSIDRGLVDQAFNATADLLTPAMQPFRTRLVTSIRRVALAGETQQTQIRDVAKAIDDAGFSGAAFKAERMIRTELGRVFTAENFASMEQLAARMPFIRKAWRATRDNRTRLGHVEAGKTYGRGNGIRVRDRFSVNVYQEAEGKGAKLIGVASLRFPIDPEATPAGKLAAGATIMCRCSSFLDFDLADLRAFSTSRAAGRPTTAPVPEPEAPPLDIPTGTPIAAPKPKRAPRKAPPAVAVAPVTPAPAPLAPGLERTPTVSKIPGDFGVNYSRREAIDALEASYEELLAESRFDKDERQWREALQVVSTKTGKRGALHIGERSAVSITPEIRKEIADLDEGVFIHTHPSGTAFSIDDLTAYFGLRNGRDLKMVVFGNYGTWHELSIPASATFTEDQVFALRVKAQAEIQRARARAMKRTDMLIGDLAADRGISYFDMKYAAENGDPEVEAIMLRHFQEESAQAWARFAGANGMSYRYHVPTRGGL